MSDSVSLNPNNPLPPVALLFSTNHKTQWNVRQKMKKKQKTRRPVLSTSKWAMPSAYLGVKERNNSGHFCPKKHGKLLFQMFSTASSESIFFWLLSAAKTFRNIARDFFFLPCVLRLKLLVPINSGHCSEGAKNSRHRLAIRCFVEQLRRRLVRPGRVDRACAPHVRFVREHALREHHVAGRMAVEERGVGVQIEAASVQHWRVVPTHATVGHRPHQAGRVFEEAREKGAVHGSQLLSAGHDGQFQGGADVPQLAAHPHREFEGAEVEAVLFGPRTRAPLSRLRSAGGKHGVKRLLR